MLFVVFLILLLFCILMCSCSQSRQTIDTGTEFQKYSWARAGAAGACAGISGAAWGVHESVVHHPDRIPDGWNKGFWDARISWKNKYENGNPAQGPAFPGSTTIFSSITDAKHLFGSLHRQALFGAGLVLTIGDRRPWWHYALDAGISFAAFSIGFHGIYDIAFRK